MLSTTCHHQLLYFNARHLRLGFELPALLVQNEVIDLEPPNILLQFDPPRQRPYRIMLLEVATDTACSCSWKSAMSSLHLSSSIALTEPPAHLSSYRSLTVSSVCRIMVACSSATPAPGRGSSTSAARFDLPHHLRELAMRALLGIRVQHC